MKRIALIEDGYVRDVQVFAGNPASIGEEDRVWENEFVDVKYPCLYIGIFGGSDEGEITKKAAECEEVHPDVITLVAIDEPKGDVQ